MSDIRKYDYSHVSQRRFALADAFFTAACIGIIFFDLLGQIFPLFPYVQIMGFLGAFLLVGHLTGTLIGKTVFSRFCSSRILFVLFGSLFVIGTFLFLFSSFVFHIDNDQFRQILSQNLIPAGILIFLFSIISGIKNNYLLKVSCGTFFDEKNGSISIIFALLSGLASGSILFLKSGTFIPVHFYGILLLPSLIFLFLIKLEYSPVPFLAKNIDNTVNAPEVSHEFRDDIFFTYLNFSNIIIYTFLAGESFFRYFGETPFLKMVYLIFIIGSLAAGFLLAVFVRRLILFHVYAEVFYPFLFMAFFLLIHTNHLSMSYPYALVILFPIMVLFGMSLHHSTRCISLKNDHVTRYGIICFSIFILPAPILTAIILIPFSQIVFFVIFYALAIINIVLPGLFIAQKCISELKKGIYFIFAVTSVPLFVFIHFYFSIPFSLKPFVDRVSGYEQAAKLNLTTDFLQKEADIYFDDTLIFHISDQSLRSIRQATISLSLFADPMSDNVLFLDGIHSFYTDPVQSMFKGAFRISYVPREYTGITKLSAEHEKIATDEIDLTIGLSRLSQKPDMIVDIPNIYDQKTNEYRFSEGYYRVIKSHLSGKRIYAQFFDISRGDRDLFSNAINALKKEFKNGATMLFGETLVVFASDTDSLVLSTDSLTRIKDMCSRNPSLQTAFFSEIQPLTHFVKKGFPLIDKKNSDHTSLYYLLNKPAKQKHSSMDFFNDYRTNHLVSLEFFAENDPYRANVERELKANERVFTILKIAEYASIKRDIETETSCLLDLKKMGEYNPPLRQYALSFLSFREKTFFNTALALENDKLWDDAGKIYRSILLINPSSYDANYRMSVISLTQQKINDASSYLQTAMRLQPDNPNVMHQMGVILFTIGKYNDALTYLQKAIALKKYDSPTYFYIGLCYEELNRLTEAAEYYNQAILKDPMNQDNISAIERIKSKLEKQNAQWQMPELKNQNEVEHGEDFPLPINKSAIDVRLKDDNPGTDLNQKQTNGKAQ